MDAPPASLDPGLEPLGVDDLQRELHTRIYRFLMRLRLFVAPLPLVLGGLVMLTDEQLWRRVALALALGSALVGVLAEEAFVRRTRPRTLDPPLVIIGILQSVVVICTGGVVSPVVLAMLLVAFVSSTMLERRVTLPLVAFFVVVVWLAGALELLRWLGPLVPTVFRPTPEWGPGWAFTLVLAVVESMVMLVALEMGSRIRVAFADLLQKVTTARNDTLRVHAERVQELTQLSGEIAHELKNPLASVKGLASLLARSATGADAENLEVLRHEVTRMQTILDEFLNFSRPLVPLALQEVNLAELVARLCALHEGWSATHRVGIELTSQATSPVRCDPRKVKQILINLLQNALEATPPGGTVRVRVAADERAARVVVEDEGPGVDPRVSGRVFDAGVTTKPRGSGLGLVVARGLARQHGGDVTLDSPPGGGGVATLWLPVASEGGSASPDSRDIG